MQYCDDCRTAQDWPGSRVMHPGTCEICRKPSRHCHGAPKGSTLYMIDGAMIAGRYVRYSGTDVKRVRVRSAARKENAAARGRAQRREVQRVSSGKAGKPAKRAANHVALNVPVFKLGNFY